MAILRSGGCGLVHVTAPTALFILPFVHWAGQGNRLTGEATAMLSITLAPGHDHPGSSNGTTWIAVIDHDRRRSGMDAVVRLSTSYARMAEWSCRNDCAGDVSRNPRREQVIFSKRSNHGRAGSVENGF
jgi:hypothetical protein